jgi:sugar lactone lactonase YvrE
MKKPLFRVSIFIFLAVMTFSPVYLKADFGDYLFEWGMEYSFFSPYGLTMDGYGRVYVADTYNNRIQVFDGDGNLLDRWGSVGTEDGQFSWPCSLAVNDNGMVYVVDMNNSRIQVFDPDGNFIDKWGGDGTDIGKFKNPLGIAINSEGDVYVADTNNGRIQVFNSNGDFITQWDSWYNNQAYPGYQDQFQYPRGIAIDSSGYVYVTEYHKDSEDNMNFSRVIVFDRNGIFLRQWGTYGSAPGDFYKPHGISIDRDGYVYISDIKNARIQVFDSNGVFIGHWGVYGEDDGMFISPYGVTANGNGIVYVADTNNHRIQIFNVQFFYTDEVQIDVAYSSQWNSHGNEDGEFRNPLDAAADSEGNLYVADTNNHRVQVFYSTGEFKTKWGSYGTGEGQFRVPSDVAVNENGEIYVADSMNHRIQVFDDNGNFLTQWGSYGSGEGQFSYPRSVAVGSSGNVYVVDMRNYRIQEFTGDGYFVKQWGSNGTGDGQFINPRGLAVDRNNNLYVSDISLHRIQIFDSNGDLLNIFGSGGSEDGQFESPHDIAVDSHDNVYVIDTGNRRVQILDSENNLITKWGSWGSGPGQFITPFGIEVGENGEIYVVEYRNNRIQVFDGFVANRPPEVMSQIVTVIEDTPTAFTLKASDPDGDPLSYSLTLPSHGVLSGEAPDLVYTPDENYDRADNFTFVVSDGEYESKPAKVLLRIIQVNDPPEAVSGAYNVLEDTSLDITLIGVDVEDDSLTYSNSSPEHGDLTGTPPELTYIPDQNYVGMDSFTFTVNDGVLESDQAVISISIEPANDIPLVDAFEQEEINEGESGSFELASFVDPDPSDTHSALIDWGDGTTGAGVVSETEGGGKVSGTHIYEENGVYTITITVTDSAVPAAGIGYDVTKITVRNLAPSIDVLTGPKKPVKVGTQIEAKIIFSDPGVHDTHLIVWDWGDGTATTVNLEKGVYVCKAKHVYQGAGIYTINATVTDNSGGSVSEQFKYVRVYDLYGWYVKGVGWMYSPRGNYIPDSKLRGGLFFGFSAKFWKWDSKPEGHAFFYIKAAGLKFHSTNYEWLVVEGERAQLKGTGKINGKGFYGFMLTAIDSNFNRRWGRDKLRIKIWNLNTNEIIYDTQPGEDDDAELTNRVYRGSIIIHKFSRYKCDVRKGAIRKIKQHWGSFQEQDKEKSAAKGTSRRAKE